MHIRPLNGLQIRFWTYMLESKISNWPHNRHQIWSYYLDSPPSRKFEGPLPPYWNTYIMHIRPHNAMKIRFWTYMLESKISNSPHIRHQIWSYYLDSPPSRKFEGTLPPHWNTMIMHIRPHNAMKIRFWSFMLESKISNWPHNRHQIWSYYLDSPPSRKFEGPLPPYWNTKIMYIRPLNGLKIIFEIVC